MKATKSHLTLGLALACAALTFSFAVRTQAQTVTFLHAFSGNEFASSLIQATDGNFYGASSAYEQYYVFRMTPSGQITTLHNFCNPSTCFVPGTPTLGTDGNLYGVAADSNPHFLGGIFYQLTLDGKLTVLYTFCSTQDCPDGSIAGGITRVSDGDFYGISAFGGAHTNGNLFRISSTGQLKVLYSFCSLANCADGSQPFALPIEDSDGNLYGTTFLGGAYNNGVIYKLTPDGAFTVLYNFCSLGCADGSDPSALVQDGEGNLFGTHNQFGLHGSGNIFELTAAGRYIPLHNFDRSDGWGPASGLILANDGNFYGNTEGGGTTNLGTLFQITPTGGFTSLYSFPISSWQPGVGLFQGTDGKIYGATLYNVANGSSIFSLENNLGPLVETVPTMGKAGTHVLILGNNLTGTTSVKFNGIEAKFTVESDTYIKATVPSGATTGTVSVVTPSGTLNSNPAFQVVK